MNNKSRYTELCIKHQLPIFYHPAWLDIVCGPSNWNLCLVFDPDENFQGSLIYFKKKRLGLNLIKMPVLTSYSGLWLNYPSNLKQHSIYAFEKKVISELLKQLPKFELFYQQLYPTFINALPFQWAGFKASYVYTYRLALTPPELMYDNLKGSIRTDLKKAAKTIKVQETASFQEFESLLQESYKVKAQALPYDLAILKKLDSLLAKSNQRKILVAKNFTNQIVAGLYLILDTTTAYYFIGARNSALDQHEP